MVANSARPAGGGESLAQGMSSGEIGHALGQAVEAVQSVALLANAAREARLDTPALDGLTALLEGRIEPERWTAAVTAPDQPKRRRPIRAA
jgi:glycerol-3-phosphate dehydrogenase